MGGECRQAASYGQVPALLRSSSFQVHRIPPYKLSYPCELVPPCSSQQPPVSRAQVLGVLDIEMVGRAWGPGEAPH
jgi:hypothetical protein